MKTTLDPIHIDVIAEFQSVKAKIIDLFVLLLFSFKYIGGSLESPCWLHLIFCPKILGDGRDLQMVLCHSMNAGSVVGNTMR